MIYLYIKQHSITGLKYFGKTTKKNPFLYNGSGKYWKNHINKHSKEYIVTLDVYGFDDQELCTEFALNFSLENNIIQSSKWTNLREENGIDGAPKGFNMSYETKNKISKSLTGKKAPIRSEQHKKNLILSRLNKPRKNSTKIKIRDFYYKNYSIENKIKDIVNCQYPNRGSIKKLSSLWNVSHTSVRRFICKYFIENGPIFHT